MPLSLFALKLAGSSAMPAPQPTVNNSVGMLFACWAIVIVLVAMFAVFMRAGKKDYAVAVIPLAILPFVHVFSRMLAEWMSAFLPLTAPEIRVAVDLVAALVSCLLIGLASRGIAERRTRNALSWSCAGFVIILALVLIVNVLMDARM